MENVSKEKVISSYSSNLHHNITQVKEYRLLQPVWDLRLGYEDVLVSPLFPIIMSVVFYFICVAPWTIIDLWGRKWSWYKRSKIQPERTVTVRDVTKAVSLTIWNQVIFILPVAIAQWLWQPRDSLPHLAPTVFEFCFHQIAALAVFDLEYWMWHSLHHKVRFLYKHVHSVHHQYSAPHSWVTQYLHPWELISVGFFATTSPWVFKAHPLTAWSFQNFSIAVSVDAHIGYDLWFLPHHWCPFWGGSIKHDMHHQRPLTNFEPFFNWWDRLAGWECPGQLAGGYKPKRLLEYEEKEKKMKEAKRAARLKKD